MSQASLRHVRVAPQALTELRELLHVHSTKVIENLAKEQDDDNDTDGSNTPANGAQNGRQDHRLSLWANLWRQAEKRSGLTAVLDEDGTPIDDENGLNKLLEHWADVFDETSFDQALAQDILMQHAVKFPKIHWHLTLQQFHDIIMTRKDSACGPDGVPYSAYKAAGQVVWCILYRCYCDWIQGRPLPSHFNDSWLWLLPKGNDSSIPGARHPKNTRPLSGTDCSAKLLPTALSQVMHEPMNRWCHEVQQGFICGRHMEKNIIHGENDMFISAATDAFSTCILFDFVAAFPSLARKWLFLVLWWIGIPNRIVRAILELYKDNHHYFNWKGKVHYAFCSKGGVKQGCPLSGILFAIALDPLIRYIMRSVSPRNTMQAYADDILMVVKCLWSEIETIAKCFIDIKKVANLGLNLTKTIVIPLWKFEKDHVRTAIDALVPSWCNVAIASKGKALGLWIGPSAMLDSWAAPMNKVRDRIITCANLHAGDMAALMTFRMVAFAVTQFVAQFSEPPRDATKTYNGAISRLLKGPGGWITTDIITSMQRHLGMPMEAPDFACACKAVRWRTALHHKEQWATAMRNLTAAETNCNYTMAYGSSEWRSRLPAVVLAKAFTEIQQADLNRSTRTMMKTAANNEEQCKQIQKCFCGYILRNYQQQHRQGLRCLPSWAMGCNQ